MTNTYFGPGAAPPEQIIADTPRALYAKSLSGGEVNPATGEFVFGVAEGYLIEGGKITTPVRGATLIGSGAEVLLNIDAIADDLDVKPGTCGKEGQHVSVGTGQPTLRIRELTVGGTSLRMSGTTPSPLQIARRALDRGRRLGADLEVYFQAGRTATIKVYGGEVESVSMAEPRGLGVRAVQEGPGGLRLHRRPLR